MSSSIGSGGGGSGSDSGGSGSDSGGSGSCTGNSNIGRGSRMNRTIYPIKLDHQACRLA